MRIVVITGLSGSGKSTGTRALEDIGFYAIDNLPGLLLEKMVDLLGGLSEVQKLALVVDARAAHLGTADIGEGDSMDQLSATILRTRNAGYDVDVVFLDASDDELERRYSETRRRHPHSDQSVRAGIATERRLLEPLRRIASTTIDTTKMSVHDLKRAVQSTFRAQDASSYRLSVTVLSFGYKHGVPTDADLMFDVRFLPNPYFVDELRESTGKEKKVADYVLERSEAQTFLEKITDLLDFLIPLYEHEGKAYLTVAIGCTGGRHRSVAVTEWLGQRDSSVTIRHRDLDR